MCGIAGVVSLSAEPIPDLEQRLRVMGNLLRHRGPDDRGRWRHAGGHAGLEHRRLSIIDLSASARQPMADPAGNQISYNGEIYNYLELRGQFPASELRTKSDTETILHAYARWGTDCLTRFRGMFAFALWDESSQALFCARDRFGIKPFYYTVAGGRFYFASEAKALLPFVPGIETDPTGFADYLTFQFCLPGKTMFRGIQELPGGHHLTVRDGQVRVERYWEVYYRPDFDHTERWFEGRLRELVTDSVATHLRADVPVGAYLSGGLDSSIVTSLAAERVGPGFLAFSGKFCDGPEYDESRYARDLIRFRDAALKEVAITADDFANDIRDVIWHLDYPAAGPGAMPQYAVSRLASRDRKVVLGGQGGDEVFGGYGRYLIAYFEQCIKGAIDGTMKSGRFVVTYESIIPNLTTLASYKPLLQEFWREGLFDEMDRRYLRLIDRSVTMKDEIVWEALDADYNPADGFRDIFRAQNVGTESYFDSMTHFDFKTLLPALLQVEDRMSMAHGLESRVPLLDHPLVEFAATMPADVKFKNGTMKHALRQAMRDVLPESIAERKDKMGFPVPVSEWVRGPLRDFVHDVLGSAAARSRPLVRNALALERLDQEPKYGRKIWGLLSLELWYQQFHDRQGWFGSLMEREDAE